VYGVIHHRSDTQLHLRLGKPRRLCRYSLSVSGSCHSPCLQSHLQLSAANLSRDIVEEDTSVASLCQRQLRQSPDHLPCWSFQSCQAGLVVFIALHQWLSYLSDSIPQPVPLLTKSCRLHCTGGWPPLPVSDGQ
jgi:hypothetical protein